MISECRRFVLPQTGNLADGITTTTTQSKNAITTSPTGTTTSPSGNIGEAELESSNLGVSNTFSFAPSSPLVNLFP